MKPAKKRQEAQSFAENPALLLTQQANTRPILVIENGTGTRFTEAALRNYGFSEILAVHDEASMWQALQENQAVQLDSIGAIIIDIPDSLKTKLELCRSLNSHELTIDIPTLFISSKTDWLDDIFNTALQAGATDVLFKPFSPIELMSRIYILLKLKEEREQNKHIQKKLEIELAERKIMEARLKYLVSHDNLTGLCNRQKLAQALDIAILQSELNGKSSVLIYIDLDQFKVINDLEGHDYGDQLLIDIANLLRKQSASNITIARVSSDEFALLIEGSNEECALNVAQQIKLDLEEYHYNIEDRIYHIRASIGVATLHPHENITSSQLLARSDQACFEAKRKGRNIIHIFDIHDSKFDSLRDDAYWVPLIKDALENSKFRLVFQPVMNILTGDKSRYEALIRMQDDNGNMISPIHFIPVAERMGLIHEIDFWVIDEALSTVKKHFDQGNDISLNINISNHAFQIESLLPYVKEKLNEYIINPINITFEITETTAVANYDETRAMTQELKNLGFSIALDDFGSGFNSFNHLKHLPVDYIKIDGGFISNLINDEVDQALVKSIIEISKSLNKKTVAEFVLNEETLSLLKEYGVDYAQGYFIGKPSKHLLK